MFREEKTYCPPFWSRLYVAVSKVTKLLCMNFYNSYTICPMHAQTLSFSAPIPLAEWELKNQIQQLLNDKLTGQIQITFPNNRTASLFVQYGKVRELYIRNHRIPNLNWETPIKRFGRGTLEIEPMPMRALMLKKSDSGGACIACLSGFKHKSTLKHVQCG